MQGMSQRKSLSAGLWGLILEARVHGHWQLLFQLHQHITRKIFTAQDSHLSYSHDDAWLFSSASRSALKVCAGCDACASVAPCSACLLCTNKHRRLAFSAQTNTDEHANYQFLLIHGASKDRPIYGTVTRWAVVTWSSSGQASFDKQNQSPVRL